MANAEPVARQTASSVMETRRECFRIEKCLRLSRSEPHASTGDSVDNDRAREFPRDRAYGLTPREAARTVEHP